MRRNGRKVISEKKTSGSKTIEKQDVAIRREWRWFLIRLLILIGILYLLFGVMFGITTVKNEDMSPRMSAGERGRFGRNYRTGNGKSQRECRAGTKYFLSDSAI